MTRAGRRLAWLAGLVAAGAALRLAGSGDLAGPPLGSPSDLVGWVDARDPATAAVALVRLAAELAVWYVLALSALHVAAGALRVAGAHRLADALALPAVTRLVRAGLGIGVATATTLSPASGSAVRSTATMAPVSAGTAVAAPSDGTAVMRPAPDPITRPAPAPAAPPVAATTWTVEPGESLWTIAQETVADALGRPATDAEVDPYWRRLVEANRARLVDPADPDLIHPGQVLELPPLA